MQDSGKQEGKTFHKLHVLGRNDDLWDRTRGFGSESWKECEWVELLVFLTRLRETGIISLHTIQGKGRRLDLACYFMQKSNAKDKQGKRNEYETNDLHLFRLFHLFLTGLLRFLQYPYRRQGFLILFLGS